MSQNENEYAPYALPARFYLATVKSGSNNQWKVQFYGTDSTTKKYVRSAGNLSVSNGNKVLIVEINGTFLIIARFTN